MPKPQRSAADILGFVLLAGVLAFVAWRMRPGGVAGDGSVVALGTPLPPLAVEGWLNLPEDESFDPAGELVVVDFFATWCGPCVQGLPELAIVAADYQARGVKFVSLTQETAVDLPKLNRLIADVPGFDWPVGYGATAAFGHMVLEGIPTIVLFGRDGKARWSGHSSFGLPAAIDAALLAR